MISDNEKTNLISKINILRFHISSKLKTGFITENDLERIFSESSNYGITNFEGRITKKDVLLKQIFNNPFLILDQETLSSKCKNKLLIFLKKRYDIEINELEYLCENGCISIDEFLDRKEMLKFCYYSTSEEGKSILERKKIKVK